MPENESPFSIQVSLLDKLLDDEPWEKSEVPWDDYQKIGIIRRGIKRDLQDLLNSRIRCVTWQSELSELDQSLINYGLPDFRSAGLNMAYDPDVLLKAIRRAIAIFEPRLTEVNVELNREHYHVDRTFRFKIDAVLLIEHRRHPIRLETTIESRTGQISIGGEAE